jgi:hypothetical protein
MKYGLKTVEELGRPEEGELIVSITNNCKLTKGKTYIVEKGSYPKVKNDKGEWTSDMSLFVFEWDWKKAMRDLKLRKIGI